ncbi:MAG: hypothetical protein KKB13_21270 [Chloroflexi bacterium]|nr:hypothetical protein [Chloroflexota bacterium]
MKSKISRLGWKKITIVGVSILLIVGLAIGLSVGLSGGGSKTTESTTTTTETTSTQTFSNDNWGEVNSNPSGYSGAKVSGLVGKIFVPPEQANGGVAIQMYADPANSDKNTIVYYFGSDASQFANGDLIKVDGTVGKQFTGQNAMGASLTVPTINASSITKTDSTALITGGKDVPVNQQQNQNGIIVTVDKMVLRDNETDFFVRIQNQSGTNASFSSYASKLQAGNQQLDLDNTKTYQYGEIPSEILPGVEVKGVLAFPAIGSPQPPSGAIALHLEARSDNYMVNFSPYVFSISW